MSAMREAGDAPDDTIEDRRRNRTRKTAVARTSSSLVVSRTRFCTTCCVALAPTRPPRPGPVTGSSGLRLFLGSIRSFSRLRFVLRPTSLSRNIGNACGVIIVGAATASDMSSIVAFLGGPLLRGSFAPLSDISGEYRTHMCPFDKPVTIYILNEPRKADQ